MPTSLGPAEILVILVVALIVLGPKRLPEAGRQVGKALAEVRRWTTDVTSEIKSVMDVEAPTYSNPAPSVVVEPVVVSATETSVAATTERPASEVVEPATVSVDEPAVPIEPAVPTEPILGEPILGGPMPSDSVSVEPRPVAEMPESPPGDPHRP